MFGSVGATGAASGSLGYLLLLPVLTFVILWRKRANLDAEEVKLSLSTLYLNLNTKQFSAVVWSSVFMLRRILFAVSIALIGQNLVLQLTLLIYLTHGMLAFQVLNMPFQDLNYNLLALVNEILLLTALTLMFLYSDFVGQPETRYGFGEMLLDLMYFNFAANLVIILFEVLSEPIRQQRLKYKKYQELKRLRKSKKSCLRRFMSELISVFQKKRDEEENERRTPREEILT